MELTLGFEPRPQEFAILYINHFAKWAQTKISAPFDLPLKDPFTIDDYSYNLLKYFSFVNLLN